MPTVLKYTLIFVFLKVKVPKPDQTMRRLIRGRGTYDQGAKPYVEQTLLFLFILVNISGEKSLVVSGKIYSTLAIVGMSNP
jgi:hypothetical protein